MNLQIFMIMKCLKQAKKCLKHPQMFLKEFKYIEKKVIKHILIT